MITNEDDKIAKSSNFAVGNMMIKKITWIKVVYVVYLYLSNIYHIFLSPADNGTLVAVEEGWVGTTPGAISSDLYRFSWPDICISKFFKL